MPLQSGSLQTPVTDSGVSGILDGQVTAMDVLDPTENNEKTALLEVDDEVFLVRGHGRPAASVITSERGVTAGCVRWALSYFHDDHTLPASSLLALLTPPVPHPPAAVRQLLNGALAALSASVVTQDQQAARALTAYHIDRTGPHEAIAEMMFLSRPTYFRRLQHGYRQLAVQLASADTLKIQTATQTTPSPIQLPRQPKCPGDCRPERP
jgi:hypothetical protein